MDWLLVFAVMIGGVVFLILAGMPVAMAFISTNLIGAMLYFGGEIGIVQMIRNLRPSIANYSMVPIALFVLMGEIMLQTGMAQRAIEAIEKLSSAALRF